MELKPGKTIYSNMTFDCDEPMCDYSQSGRCIYNVAKLQIETGKHCHSEMLENEIECQLDYLDACRS